MAMTEGVPAAGPAPTGAPLRARASVFSDEISMDFEEACRTARAAGLRCVDLRKVWGVFSHEVPRERWSELATILADNGLRVGALQSNFGKCPISGPEYETHLAFFPSLVEQARYFGTDTMRVFPFWNESELDPDSPPPGGIRPNLEGMLPEIVRRFRPAADLAGREGLRLGFEPEHTTYSGSPQEVARIVEAVDRPHVGVAWDVSNGWEDADLETAYALFRGKVVNVHIKDRALTTAERRAVRATQPAGSPPRRLLSLLGNGIIPWTDLIARLERDGYHGLYTIETHFGSRGPFGWPKLRAATTYYMFALREILEDAEAALEASPPVGAGARAGA
jgi:sugar phosphate isomerase/epimerase